MPAQVINIEIEQGATFSQDFVCKDSDGNPINLTGFTATGSIRQSLDDALPVASFTCVVSTPVDGIVTASMTAAQTGAIQPFVFMYDIEATNGSTVYKVARGGVNVIGEITT